jgi:hypothetical protein
LRTRGWKRAQPITRAMREASRAPAMVSMTMGPTLDELSSGTTLRRP